MKWRQQLLSQNDKVLQSLRVELKVYEKLDEEHRIPRGAGRSGPRPLSASLCLGLSAHPNRVQRSFLKCCHLTPHVPPGHSRYILQQAFSEGAAGNMEGSGGRPAEVWVSTGLVPGSVAFGR